jgi:uncharacterized circularly permuted ATP-grasp superfamily protein
MKTTESLQSNEVPSELMPAQSLRSAVQDLNRSILADPAVGPPLFARLVETQRVLGLLHGSRPTCPFLRPHILSRAQYETIARAAETVALAFERLVTAALADPGLMANLGLTERESKMARIDPGYSSLCVTSRLDAYLTDEGFQFLEYNAESPAGLVDQMLLEKLLFDLAPMKEFLRRHRHWRPAPHRRLLKALVDAYREWGGDHEPANIAIVDWEGVATESEFEVLKVYFESEGYPTVIADPRALEYRDGQLSTGGFRVDILYKRVIIHEFLTRLDETHPLARAYADRSVCMANSFRTKVAHKKAGFSILSDPDYAHLFTPEQLTCIRKHVPWTRFLAEGRVYFEGLEHDMMDILLRERERLVLKPNDDYGGHGIVIGWETNPAVWEQAIRKALGQQYIVQERAPVDKITMPVYTDHLEMQEMLVDFDPFLFLNEVEGGLVRLSSSSMSNVSSGAGETALLVLEDID